MNPKSAEMAQGLERIDLRAPKLLKAKERRLERLAEQRRSEEDKSVTGQPTINQKSREIAERLTPARRKQIVEQRRQLLLQEAAREKENCSFKPKIDSNSDRVASRRNSFSVTHRLLRDVEMRKHKHERLVELRERELMADCRDVPEISHVGKSFFVDAPVHERLFPRSPPREEAASTRSKSVGAPVSRTAMPFSQYWGSVAQPMTESVQLGRDSVQFVPRDSVQLAPMESSFFKSASPRRFVTPPVPSVAELRTTRTPGVRTQTLVGRPEDSTRRSSRLDLSSVFAFTKRSSN